MLQMFDPAQVTYMSESIAAYLIAALRIIAWLWLLRSSYVTVRKYVSGYCTDSHFIRSLAE